MSGVFRRRYTFDPGLAEILKIEGVVIIDREAPGNTTGEETGATILVAEFEDGPYNAPTEIFGGQDQLATFGGFGFTSDGLVSSNPCARARKADSAVNPEYWNGNGFLALSQKTYPRLILVRPDTSVGSVQFSKQASLIGNANFAYDLEPGATAVFRTSATVVSTATFNAAVAVLTTGTGSYPTGFAGGESFNVTIDPNTPLQIGPVDVVMTVNEQTQAQVLARINAVLGFTCAVTSSGTVFTMSGRVRGNTGAVVINSISGGTITSKLGLTAGQNAVGTGNVGNIDQVTFGEAKAVIQAAVSGSTVDKDSNGNLRVSIAPATAAELHYVSTSTADGLGFTKYLSNQQPSGFAYLYSTAGTYPVTCASDTLTLGFDGDQNVTISFTNGSTTQAQIMSQINAAFPTFTAVTGPTSTVLRFQGHINGGQVRVVAGTANILTALGLTAGITQTAVLNQDTAIPAGVRVRTTAGAEWLVTQTTAVPATAAGPFSVKVRPSLDDGSAGSATAASVTVLADAVPLMSFAVTNPLGLSAALSEAAIDAAYATAIAATLNPSSVAADANFIVSARQSNAVRLALRANASAASFSLRGRVAVVAPPLGTTRANARSTVQAPGVGATAGDRVFYAYPGQNVFISQIAARGTGGGAGFTASGFVDLHSDTAFASVAGLLPPEQNAGQETGFMPYMAGVEAANPDVQALTMDDYVAFKRAGIVAPRIQGGVPIFQSDVTSYQDPTSSKADGPRRRFADFVEDSLAEIASPFVKKPMTAKRRGDVFGQSQAFLEGLKSPGNPDSSRLFDYVMQADSKVNPPQAIDAGAFRIRYLVGMNPDMLDIVIDITVQRGSVATSQAA